MQNMHNFLQKISARVVHQPESHECALDYRCGDKQAEGFCLLQNILPITSAPPKNLYAARSDPSKVLADISDPCGRKTPINLLDQNLIRLGPI